MDEIALQRLPGRRLQDQSAEILVYFATEHDLPTGPELPDQVGLVEPNRFDGSRGIGDDGANDGAATPRRSSLGIPDRPDDGRLFPILQAVDRLERSIVLVSVRYVVQEVADRVNAQALEA